MDERLREIVENIDEYRIGLDDPFKFKCRSCGKCCRNREDILFTARDVFRISKHLGKKPEEVVRAYCEWYIGHDSRVPIIRLQPQGIAKVCPFLEDKHCSINEVKPVVCALYPVGRTMMANTEGLAEGEEPVYVPGYILQPADCGSGKKTNTVRQWLEKFDIPVEDEFYIEWNKALIHISGRMKDLEKHCEQKSLVPLQDALFELMYIRYDTEAELLDQFRDNIVEAREILDEIHRGLQEYLQKTGGDDNGE